MAEVPKTESTETKNKKVKAKVRSRLKSDLVEIEAQIAEIDSGLIDFVPPNVDLDRLAYAVAMQESSIKGKPCASLVARKYKNCHGLTNFRKGGFMRFNSFEESYIEFKRLWSNSTYYGGMPTLEKARKYAGPSENANIWLRNVLYYMNQNI